MSFPKVFSQLNLNNHEYYKKIDAFTIKDINHLIEVFIKDFFGDSTKLLKSQFELKFTQENSFGWIFCCSGIRQLLEINNVPNDDVV